MNTGVFVARRNIFHPVSTSVVQLLYLLSSLSFLLIDNFSVVWQKVGLGRMGWRVLIDMVWMGLARFEVWWWLDAYMDEGMNGT